MHNQHRLNPLFPYYNYHHSPIINPFFFGREAILNECSSLKFLLRPSVVVDIWYIRKILFLDLIPHTLEKTVY